MSPLRVEHAPRIGGWAWLALPALLLSGCAQAFVQDAQFASVDPAWDDALEVPAAAGWVDTGIRFEAGQPLTVLADGEVQVRPPDALRQRPPLMVGSNGTYDYDDDLIGYEFPLASTGRGPAPCFCLMGRVGHGEPFYVGERCSRRANAAGTLQLAVNDFDGSDNAGAFLVRVETPPEVQPIRYENVLGEPWQKLPASATPDVRTGRAAPGRHSVVVFYVDGLRPDVVREMVDMGHLPNIRRLFFEGGAWLEHACTAFPSDTITSNGTLWTGCFSDRHGLKGQVRFSRRTLKSDSYLEALGPNRSARLLAPQGIDEFLHRTSVETVRAVAGEEQAEQFRQSRTTGVAPLYEYLRAHGADWATGILPVMTDVPPLLWTRSIVRFAPVLAASEFWKYVDDANVHYAKRRLLSRESPVTVVWLPETDSVSHKQSRGQFGLTRRTIARADALIGEVVDELESAGRREETYFVLLSDHGHHGGRRMHLSHLDLVDDVLFAPREVDEDGNWTGGGLGLSVRQHRFWNRHAGDGSREFVFVDGESDGVARLFLPKGRYGSGDWSGPNEPATLFDYEVAEGRPPLDLVGTLTDVTARHASGRIEKPVDLVLLKLDDQSILISTADRGRAVIHRRRGDDGKWLYRYTVVENVRPMPDGTLDFDVAPRPATDPLGLEKHLPASTLHAYHDESTWLRLTFDTEYPDAVVTLTRHLLWDESLRYREPEYAPDLVVTAKRGWYFGRRESPGTMHGYPFEDSVRACLFVSGPKVRRGTRITSPVRLVDVTPTLLEMAGIPFDPERFDGRPIRSIYESGTSDAPLRPVYWEDVDLGSWQPLEYVALAPSEHLPVEVNDPGSPWDLNNLTHSLLSITELNALRLVDDVLSPVNGGRDPFATGAEEVEQKIRHTDPDWVGEGVKALDPAGVAVGDYSLTSLGNMLRIDGSVDWVQDRTRALDRRLAEPLGLEQTPPTAVVNGTVDAAQAGFWEFYRFAQRVMVQVLEETMLNGLEDGTARTINSFRRVPAEVRVRKR